MAASKSIQGPSSNASSRLASVRDAAAIAAGLRNAAEACTADQSAARTRLVVAAATIDSLCELLQRAIAKKAASSRNALARPQVQSNHALVVVGGPTLGIEDLLTLHLALDLLDRVAQEELAKACSNTKQAATINMRSRVLIVRAKLQAMENAQ